MAPPPPPRPAVRSRWEKLASRRAPSAPRPHPVYLSRGSRWQARPVPGAGPTARVDRGWRLLTKPLCSFAGRHRPPEHWHHSSACPAGRRPRCRPRAGRGARGGTHGECHQRGQTQPAAATFSRPLFLPAARNRRWPWQPPCEFEDARPPRTGADAGLGRSRRPSLQTTLVWASVVTAGS